MHAIQRFLIGTITGLLKFLSVWACFALVLWLTQGQFKGLPALLGSVLVAFFWWRRRVHALAARQTGPLSRWALARQGMGGLLALVPLAVVLLPAGSAHLSPLPAAPGIELWTTVAERVVAVHHISPPPGTATRHQALLFVHGGPGGYVRNFDRDFFASFALHGFEVFLYDQYGSGRSPVGDSTGYTHTLAVRDLQAVLERINKPIILVGQSYGAALVTSALADAQVRSRVTHVVLTEPGKLPGASVDLSGAMSEKTTTAPDASGPPTPDLLGAMLHPRTLAAGFLPGGHRLVPAGELINLFQPEVQRALIAASYCKGKDEQLADFEALHFNPLANVLLGRSALASPAPQPVTLSTPVMLLLGECSYVPRGRALAYFDVLPITQSYWVAGVGHILWGTPTGQQRVRDAIVRFVDQQTIDLPPGPQASTREAFWRSGR